MTKNLTAASVEVTALKPGQRLAIFQMDGTVKAGDTIVTVQDTSEEGYPGNVYVTLKDATGRTYIQTEDAYRVSHRSTWSIAKETA